MPPKRIEEITDSNELLRLGKSYYTAGEIAKAKECYERAAEIDPNNHIIWTNLAMCYNYPLHQDLPKAVELAKKALSIKPDYYPALNQMGFALCDLRKYDEAIESFERALKIKPDDYEVLIYLGRAYYQSGHYTKAIEYYQQAIKNQPTNYFLWFYFGQAYHQLGDFLKAIEHYQTALKIKPDYRPARDDLEIVLKKAAQAADSCVKRAIQLLELGKAGEATKLFEEALQLVPNHQKALKGLAETKQLVIEKETGIRQEREDNLRKIIKTYEEISLDLMARLLKFEDTFALQEWIIHLPREQAFYIKGEKVIIPKELQSSQQAIDKLVKNLDSKVEATDRFCFHCDSPLAPGERLCTNCNNRCEICKMAVCRGEAIALCPFCGRTFHYNHLREVIRVSGKCPVCRAELKEKWYIIAEQAVEVEAKSLSDHSLTSYSLNAEVIIQIIDEGFKTLEQKIDRGFSESKERQLTILVNQERLLEENKELVKTLIAIDQAIRHNQEVTLETFESLAGMIEGLTDDYLQIILDKLHEDKSLRGKVMDKMKELPEELAKEGAVELVKETAKGTGLKAQLKGWLKGSVRKIRQGNIPVFQIVKLVLSVALTVAGVPIPLGIL